MTTQWQHIDILRSSSMTTVATRDIESLRALLSDLDGQIWPDLTAAQESALDRAWDALRAIASAPAPANTTAPVIAFLRREPFDGAPALTATIRVDDDEGAGYTIPELIVGSDGVRESGPPHFDRYDEALAWARESGWRVYAERTVDPE